MTTSVPLVSVLIPTYNRANSLPKAVRSILEGDFQDFELLIVDDGSTDNTAEVIRSLAGESDKITPMSLSTNQGLVAALNTGLDAARGNYIARLDSSEAARPDRLTKQVAALNADDQLCAVGSLFTLKTDRNGPIPAGFDRWLDILRTFDQPDRVIEDFTLGCPLPHPSVTFRRELKGRVWEYRPDRFPAEDYDLWARMILAGGKIRVLQEPLIELHIDPEGISHANRDAQIAMTLRIKLDFIYDCYGLRETTPSRFFIFGAREFGRKLAEILTGPPYRAQVHAFVDLDTALQGTRIDQRPVLTPDELEADLGPGDKLISIWNVQRREITVFLDALGLQKNRDYFVFS